MTHKLIQVGTGGLGGARCRDFLPPNIQDSLMETLVQENLQSVALVFAAIESSRVGQPVPVQELLARSA